MMQSSASPPSPYHVACNYAYLCTLWSVACSLYTVTQLHPKSSVIIPILPSIVALLLFIPSWLAEIMFVANLKNVQKAISYPSPGAVALSTRINEPHVVRSTERRLPADANAGTALGVISAGGRKRNVGYDRISRGPREVEFEWYENVEKRRSVLQGWP